MYTGWGYWIELWQGYCLLLCDESREIIFECIKFWGSPFTLTPLSWQSQTDPLQNNQSWILDLLLQRCAGTSLPDSWTSTKALLSRGNCWNWHSLGGPRLTERSWLLQAASGSRARAKVCVPITLHMSGWDSSQVPWQVVLVTGSKSNGSVAQFSGLWSCFCNSSWGDGW